MLYAPDTMSSYEGIHATPVVALNSYLHLCVDLAALALKREDAATDARLCEISQALGDAYDHFYRPA